MNNTNPSTAKNDANQKSIFSYNVYRTHNQQRTLLYPPNFKQPPATSNDPEVLYFNDKVLRKPKNQRTVKECGTQTSKTIIQLAQNQPECADVKAQETQTMSEHKVEVPDKIDNILSTTEWVNSQRTYKVEVPKDQNLPSPVTIGVKIEIIGDTKQEEIAQIDIVRENKPAEAPEVPEIPELPDVTPIDSGRMTPDSLSVTPRKQSNNFSLENCPYSVANHLSDFTLDGSCHEQDCIFNKGLDKPLTQTFLEKKRTSAVETIKSKSFIDTYYHPNYIQEPIQISVKPIHPRVPKNSCKSLDFVRNKSSFGQPSTFMCPTAASLIKSKLPEIQSANLLLPPMRRGRSTSPKPSGDHRKFETSRKIPYIDQSKSDISSSTTLINATRNPERLRLSGLESAHNSKSDCSVKFSDDILSLLSNIDLTDSTVNCTAICLAINRLREHDWAVALKGLADVVEICRIADPDIMYDYMASINQRLIELLKSPRSYVCRTACKAAGHLFEYVKDTRRPVFDEIVDILLHKTADANKFIRQDANLALDCMVTHISLFNSVRALCSKGPYHKNPLVRCATARLLVCAIVIAGTDFVLNPHNNEYTRKRLIHNMARFLEDKNLETRKLAERMYKVLSKDIRFNIYLDKYLEKEQIAKIKRNLRLIHKK